MLNNPTADSLINCPLLKLPADVDIPIADVTCTRDAMIRLTIILDDFVDDVIVCVIDVTVICVLDTSIAETNQAVHQERRDRMPMSGATVHV